MGHLHLTPAASTTAQGSISEEETEGVYCGIGVLVSQNISSGLITALRVFQGSPAEEAGICQVYVCGTDPGGNEENLLSGSVCDSRETTVDYLTPHRAVCTVCCERKLFGSDSILGRSPGSARCDICGSHCAVCGTCLLYWRKASFAVRPE